MTPRVEQLLQRVHGSGLELARIDPETPPWKDGERPRIIIVDPRRGRRASTLPVGVRDEIRALNKELLEHLQLARCSLCSRVLSYPMLSCRVRCLDCARACGVSERPQAWLRGTR
jgi:hypothetical protein